MGTELYLHVPEEIGKAGRVALRHHVYVEAVDIMRRALHSGHTLALYIDEDGHCGIIPSIIWGTEDGLEMLWWSRVWLVSVREPGTEYANPIWMLQGGIDAAIASAKGEPPVMIERPKAVSAAKPISRNTDIQGARRWLLKRHAEWPPNQLLPALQDDMRALRKAGFSTISRESVDALRKEIAPPGLLRKRGRPAKQ